VRSIRRYSRKVLLNFIKKRAPTVDGESSDTTGGYPLPQHIISSPRQMTVSLVTLDVSEVKRIVMNAPYLSG
jgi:hypothetical protein